MKTFRTIMLESTDPNLTQTKFDNGKKRFYYDGRGYFAIGEKVKTPEAFRGVSDGHVKEIMHAPEHHDHRYMYRIEHTLPKDHPEAQDEDGHPQYKKTQIVRGNDLTKLNPEHEWSEK